MARLSKKEKDHLSNEEKLVLYYQKHPVASVKDLLGLDLIWLQRIAFRVL